MRVMVAFRSLPRVLSSLLFLALQKKDKKADSYTATSIMRAKAMSSTITEQLLLQIDRVPRSLDISTVVVKSIAIERSR